MAKISPLADVIRQRMHELGFKTVIDVERKANEYAERDGARFPKDGLRNVMNGRTQKPRAERILYLAKALKLDVEDLASGIKDEKIGGGRPTGPVLRIPIENIRPYFKSSLADARIHICDSDTMKPTANMGEVCLVDVNDTDDRPGVYLVEFGNGTMAIVRVLKSADGIFYVSCDNPDYEEDVLPDSYTVVGRVCAVVRSI